MRGIPHMAILAELTSDDVLDTAYDWLCRRGWAYPAEADVWSFRQGWAQEKDRLEAALAAGRFRFGLLVRITLGRVRSTRELAAQKLQWIVSIPLRSTVCPYFVTKD